MVVVVVVVAQVVVRLGSNPGTDFGSFCSKLLSIYQINMLKDAENALIEILKT